MTAPSSAKRFRKKIPVRGYECAPLRLLQPDGKLFRSPKDAPWKDNPKGLTPQLPFIAISGIKRRSGQQILSGKRIDSLFAQRT